jgi:hypothetical protein
LKQILPIAASLTIAAIFLGFAGDGLTAYFTADDMMNLYNAWFRPLLHEQRPLGALLYRGLFAIFGLNPLPFRVLCFALLAGNLVLLYAVCARLGGSRLVGALAALLGAYHAHLADLYYSTGTIYELLCFTFYWGAVLVWMREERRWLVLPLYAGALLSKEMAVTLPLLLLVYDLAARRRPAWPLLGAMAAVTLAFAARKLVGDAAMTVNPDFVPHISWAVLLQRWQNYASDLFYGLRLNPTRVILLWIALLAAAAFTRRRESAVALAAIWAGLLPIIFIEQRGFYVVYLTLPGWYLLVSLLLARATPYVRPAILFAAVALILIPVHAARKEKGKWWVAQEHANVRSVLEPIRTESLPHGARVLFVDDPFPKDDWILTFIFRLRYRDDECRVDRVKDRPANPEVRYDRIYRLDDGHLTHL